MSDNWVDEEIERPDPTRVVREDESEAVGTISTDNHYSRDIRPLQSILSFLIGVCLIIAITASLWHGVDRQSRTRIARARADEANAVQWQKAFDACKKDYLPRFCMEAAHGIDIRSVDDFQR